VTTVIKERLFRQFASNLSLFQFPPIKAVCLKKFEKKYHFQPTEMSILFKKNCDDRH